METTGNQGMSSEELDKFTAEEAEETNEQPEGAPGDEAPEGKPPVEEPSGDEPAGEPSGEETGTDETTLAEEALIETEEPVKVDPKDAVIGDFRRQLREANQEVARLQQPEAPQPTEKSPLELAAEAQGVSIDEVEMTGKLYRDQQAYDQRQGQLAQQRQAVTDFNEGLNQADLAFTDEKLGKGLGLVALAQLGQHLLTEGDRLDMFKAGKKCGEVAVKRLRYRILEAGGENAQVLREQLKARKSQTKTKPGTPPKKTTTQVPKQTNEDTGESDVRASTSRITDELEMFD